MSNDLSIPAVNPQEPAPRQAAAGVDSTPTVATPPTAPGIPASPGVPNPILRLDPALGLVVIEFLSKSGSITSSIPSQRELNAYQDGTAQLPGVSQSVTSQPTN
jgi:hypothetical protein